LDPNDLPEHDVALREVVEYLDRLLEPERFDDPGQPNGLQVPGPTRVATVVTGVSAHAELFERAAARNADLVLVHHGLFWKGDPPGITPLLHRRLRVLFDRDMALAAYHLPLDGHPEVGNNALLAAGLGCTGTVPFAPHRGTPIGVAGTLPGDGLAPSELVARVGELCGRPPLAFLEGPPRIRSIGIVSGGGTDFVTHAVAAGLDAFLTGEPAERALGLARDEGIHFLAAGHHATETFGVRRLGELLAERYRIRHVFEDVPNPV
jgi:dinuclear metal center YbgI/SA1388 family protein